MSLISDLQDEHHTVLLESGNLLPKKQAPSFIPQWISAGYVARVYRNVCSCGSVTEPLFLGIYHREKSPCNAVRDTLLGRGFQIPLHQNFPIESTEIKILACASCLVSKGFAW